MDMYPLTYIHFQLASHWLAVKIHNYDRNVNMIECQ